MENQEPKQYVSKPLKLNSVPRSENETVNILVQGADKTVKFIPRSEVEVNADWNANWGPAQILNKPDIYALEQRDSDLQNQIYEKQDALYSGYNIKTINGESILGAGDINKTPTLQQVMDAGSAAMLNGEAGILCTSNNDYSRFYISGEMVELNNLDVGLKKALSLNLKDGELKITNQNTATGKYTMINLSADPTVNTEINFPHKETAGSYTLATLDDITSIDTTQNLQSVLTAGSGANIASTISIQTSDSSVFGNSSFTMFPNVVEDNSTGMSLYTTGMMSVAAKAIDISNTQGNGSLYIKSDGVTLNGNSKKVTLNGGAGGVFVQGSGGGFTVDCNNNGFLAVGGETAGLRIESRIGAITMEGQGGGIIMNTGSKMDINGSTANINTILNSYNQLNIRNNNGVRFYDAETYNSAISTLDTQTFTEESGTVKTVRNSGHFRNVGTLYTPRLVFENTSNGTVLNRTKFLSEAVTVDNTINLPSGESGFKNMVMSVNGVGADQHGNLTISATVTNSTAAALSASLLTSTYPQAILGFRVQCMNIASGAIIYEKTSLGWAQHSINIVS